MAITIINNFKGIKAIVLILLIVLSKTTYAQSNYELLHLGVEHGLSNNSVKSIFQDSNGFMWFGTYDGLNKFDGHLVKVFRNRISDTTSLPYNYIYSIDEDSDKNIWVATGQGVGIFNPKTEKFTSAYYKPHNGSKPVRISSAIQVVKKDSEGNMLLGSNQNGLFLKPSSSKMLLEIPYQDEFGKMKYDLNISAIAIGKKNQIFVAAAGIGICSIDFKSKVLRLSKKGFGDIVCLSYSKDKLWAGTRSGLFQYYVGSNGINLTHPTYLLAFKNKSINSVMLENNKSWVGLEGGGVDIINIDNGNIEKFRPIRDRSSVFGPTSTSTLYLDKESRKWIGSLKGGVDYSNNFKNPFKIIQRKENDPNSLPSNDISCFAELDEENIIIGSDGAGISLWNRKLDVFKNFAHKLGQPNSLSNNNVTSLIKDFKGITWISTYGGGINSFDRAKSLFKHYRCTVPGIGDNNYTWLLLEDKNKKLWASCFVGGYVYYYNRMLDTFEIFDQKLMNTISLAADSENSLWTGNSRFLIHIDQKSHKHKAYDIGKPIRAIYEDKEKNFWLGTESGGLILFDRKNEKVKMRFSDVNGLCNNSVLNILEDNSGNLWLSTFNGLSKFNKKRGTFHNYFESDGLSSNQFSFNAAFKLENGEMLFGGINGLTIFHPDSLNNIKAAPSVPYVADLQIDYNPKNKDKIYSSKAYKDKEELIIPYDEATISLSISTIDFSRSAERRFRFFLEGRDKNWTATNSSTIINYNHLDHGSYVLHVKTENGLGGLGTDTILLRITVMPPWYKTWWSYFLFLSTLGIAVYFYNKYRVRRAKMKYETMLSIEAVQKEQELNERKLRFFTEVSHEFRTPLTLIINPLREYLKRHSNTEQIEDLQRVHTNAQRLLGLVDQLLLFRKVGSNSDDLRLVKLPFDAVCRNTFDSFKDQAIIKKIKYILSLPAEPIEIFADREKIEVILNNLLSNAIKFTPTKGEIHMLVSQNEVQVKLTLIDSGPGIPKSVGNKLFEQFYQVPQTNSEAGNGFGIGLYLVKHFIDRHHATINYQSNIDNGTTFEIIFPKENKHFAGHSIHEDTHVKPNHTRKTYSMPKPDRIKLDNSFSKHKSILIAEDNVELLDFLVSILHDNYIIYKSASGNDAFELTIKHKPNIIITDLMMENGNGLELCRKVKNDPNLGHIPIIILTAVSDSEVKLTGVESGADDYITKPFQADLLLARIKTLLQNRSKLNDYFYNEITLKKHNFDVAPEYTQFLDKCISVINSHLDDENFNIKKLSAEIGMSHSTLYRKVKVISGESISSFIRFIRLRRAAELMITTDYTISEIAYHVGMSDQKYFRTKFNGLFGLNPSKYIKKYRPKRGNHGLLSKGK